jgi:predicted permease
MAWYGHIRGRLAVLLHRFRFDRELKEEMQSHLELKARENLDRGRDARQARDAARRQFGNGTWLRQTSRAAWGRMALERIAQDLGYALRTLRQSRGFTSAVVLTLALGIGVNTAIFSFVDRLLLRPLPFRDSDRLAALNFRSTRSTYVNDSMSYPDYRYFRERSAGFTGLAAYGSVEATFQFGGRARKIAGEVASANYFDVLGIAPAMGRGFDAEEDAVPGRNPVVILGYDLWQRRFAGDASVVGRQTVIDDVSFSVIGIAPAGFAGLRLDRSEKPEFWVPTMMYPVVCGFAGGDDLEHNWGNHWLSAVGRLKPGMTVARAEADFSNLTEQLKASHWSGWANVADGPLQSKALMVGANQARFSAGSRRGLVRFLTMLLVVVGLVLLIACSNIASLLLARAVKRQKEIGVRLALGASRARLAQQLLTESLLLALMGGAAGLAVAWLTSQALAGYHRPFRMDLLLETSLDGRILAFALVLSMATGLIFGAIPLRQAFRSDLIRPRSATRGLGARNLLVVAQVALSLILLVAASLFVRTLRNAQATDVTRDPARVLLVDFDLAARKYDGARARAFYRGLLDRIGALPGVERAALVRRAPLGGGRNALDIESAAGWKANADFNVVSEEYFRTIGLPLEHGRTFTAADREGAPAVTVVNELMARRYWPGEDPIGKRFRYLGAREVAIVGVIRDGRFRDYRDQPRPCFYLPLGQLNAGAPHPFLSFMTTAMKLEVRSAGPAAPLVEPLRRAISELDGALTFDVRTLAEYRDAGLAQERVSAALVSGLGLLAAVIAAVGLYGVLAFAVAQGTREIGIRMALGAGARQVQRRVLAGALGLVGGGLVLGLAAALGLARFIASLLFEVSATDPATYAGAALVLLAVGGLAGTLPARWASRVDPVVALREE